MNHYTTIRIKGRVLCPHKAIKSARFEARKVLTDNPWDFVSLWLDREQKHDAKALWSQAREFYHASQGLSLQSAPLLIYYSCMNATKALLTARGSAFSPYHGVSSENLRGSSKRIRLSNEGVEIKNNGVLPALSAYFGELETSRKHSLKELLFNLAFVHRTFCLTYRNQKDAFLPLKDCVFATPCGTKDAFFYATISNDFPITAIARYLPSSLVLDPGIGARVVRSVASTPISKPSSLTLSDVAGLRTLHESLRGDVVYINALQTLWYAKLNVKGPKVIQRHPLTLTLAAMHRLSELCRYRPLEFGAFMSSDENWLLSEFIRSAPSQFLDGIASEITGYQFMIPNVRPAA